MNVGREVEILNPYEWLPGYGETSVNFSTEDGNLSVWVEYDGKQGPEKKELLFTGVSSFYASALPGPMFLNFTYPEKSTTPMGSLTEFPDSEAAAAWTRHFGDGRVKRHYRIAFLAENSILIVFAEDVTVKSAK